MMPPFPEEAVPSPTVRIGRPDAALRTGAATSLRAPTNSTWQPTNSSGTRRSPDRKRAAVQRLAADQLLELRSEWVGRGNAEMHTDTHPARSSRAIRQTAGTGILNAALSRYSLGIWPSTRTWADTRPTKTMRRKRQAFSMNPLGSHATSVAWQISSLHHSREGDSGERQSLCSCVTCQPSLNANLAYSLFSPSGLHGVGHRFFAFAQQPAGADQSQWKQLTIQELLEMDVTTAARRADPIRNAAAPIQVLTRDDLHRAASGILPSCSSR